MRNKLIFVVALMLCVGAFVFPVTAYAASDTTPPTIRAWITGDTLHVETADEGTGVEAVYIDNTRVNYRVDGALNVILKDYAGSDEHVKVYAVDFAGNKSDTVLLKNPYYVAPTTTPAATAKPAATATPTPAATSTPTESESSVPESSEGSPFTPDGTGTVVDNVTEQNGKEFFTITTADENTFYLIIDRERDSENVYLLNAVTEDDLMALAEKSDGGGTSESAVQTPAPVTPTPEPTPEPEPEPTPEPETSGGSGSIIIIIIAVIAVGGAGYYFKILKPKRDAELNGDDEDEYDEDETDGMDDDLEFLDEPDGGYYGGADDGDIDYTADDAPDYGDEE